MDTTRHHDSDTAEERCPRCGGALIPDTWYGTECITYGKKCFSCGFVAVCVPHNPYTMAQRL